MKRQINELLCGFGISCTIKGVTYGFYPIMISKHLKDNLGVFACYTDKMRESVIK